jgi:hypothetical protein
MFRFARSNQALIEAHVKAERARHDLEALIGAAFATYETLVVRLRIFDRRLDRSRAYLRRAGAVGDTSYHHALGGPPSATTRPRLGSGRARRSHHERKRAEATAA